MFSSIKRKLLIFLVGFISMLTLVLGFTSHHLIKKYFISEQHRKLEYIANGSADNIKIFLSRTHDLLDRISDGREFFDHGENYRERALADYFIKFTKELPALIYLNKDGNEEVKVVKGRVSENLRSHAGENFFKDAISAPGKVVTIPLEHSFELEEPAIKMVMAKNFDYGDRIIGVVLGQVPLKRIVKINSRIKIGDTGFINLIDKQGNFLGASEKYNIWDENNGLGDKDIENRSDLQSMNKVFGKLTIHGTDCFVYFAPIEKLGWSILVALPYDELMAPFNRFMDTSIVILSIVFVFCLYITSRLTNSIVKPIIRLSSLTELVANGDFSHRMDVKSSDEIGKLATSFNRMTEDLMAYNLQLVSSKQYTENIIQSMINSLIVTDPNMTIQMVNDATCKLLGYTQTELIGKPMTTILSGGPSDVENMGKTLPIDPTQGAERQYTTKDGTKLSVLYSRSAFNDSKGQVGGYVCVAQDISKLKAAENELLISAEKLAQSNEELESFAHIASHDLQEPLRKVMGFGDRLKSKYEDALGEQGRDYLERMQSATGRMQGLINGLLNYSRVTTKAQPFISVNLAEVVQEVISDLEVRIEEVNGRLEVSDLPVITADPLQMRQLFQNFIGNALKFHREDEAPVVKIENILVEEPTQGSNGGSSNGGNYQITISDNGIGFDEQYADRIFGAFQRLHGRNEYEGSGIGLSICRKIVERHKGNIQAKSQAGQGATFIITLPITHDIPAE